METLNKETVNLDPSNKNCRSTNFKRKNRKNKFMTNAKGFGKRGIFGRGTEIEDHQFKYFINILDAIKLGFQSTEEKESMANNVFNETIDQEIYLSSNQIVCKCLEILIGFTDEEHFDKFLTAFSTNFRPICSDPYASHVLQKMIEIAFLRAINQKTKEETENEEIITDKSQNNNKKLKIDEFNDQIFNQKQEFTKEHREKCTEFIVKISKFLLNNLEDFLWDKFGNHIMRTCIFILSGHYIPKIAFDSKKDLLKNLTLYNVPQEWNEIVQEFAIRLEMWPQFSDLPYEELTSAFLGCLCISLKQINKNLLKHFGKKILIESFLKKDNTNSNNDLKLENLNILPKVFQFESSIRLLETLITIAGHKLYTQLYAMLFTGQLYQLSKEHLTNFAVQKLIDQVHEKCDFETIFSELCEHFEEFLKIGHSGIVYSLSNGCLKFQTKQSAFIISIQKALHILSDKNSGNNHEHEEKLNSYFECLIKLKPYEILINDQTQFVHLHGSLIIQNLLKFNKPIVLVNCILKQSALELCNKFSTPNGSHIIDAFLDSKYIGEKSREKLLRHLNGTYLDMAITKCGSHVVEKLFHIANDIQKLQIAKELAEQINRLNGSVFGRVVCCKLRIESYKLSPNQWQAGLNRIQKAEKLFQSII